MLGRGMCMLSNKYYMRVTVRLYRSDLIFRYKRRCYVESVEKM